MATGNEMDLFDPFAEFETDGSFEEGAGNTIDLAAKAVEQAVTAAETKLQKEAKAQVVEAQKINEAITAKINEKTATEEEIMSECKKAQALVRKAIKGGGVAENKLGEAYVYGAKKDYILVIMTDKVPGGKAVDDIIEMSSIIYQFLNSDTETGGE